ncbi:hypothetical protein CWI69_09110 [Pseudidiomarina halophila]|uniref:Lipopolysaccharide N-acetylmannosaminouronosyltransferase n=2 Tax=Pseudidiomarina halophila TaxID=1449799 RepID=A0A432XWT7_9GAMM|nr:hypothetical protein CWI69_09110 [Pseudidiomarina halophila]
MTSEVRVGDVPVQPFRSMEEAIAYVLNDGHVISGSAIAINPEKVMLAKEDQELRTAIERATLRYADGIGVVRTIRRKGIENIRIPGCELWQALMHRSARFSTPVMLLGARPEINEKVVSSLRALGVNVVYACDGYSLNENELFKALRETQPRIVSVAMGSPKQEKLIHRMQEAYPIAFYQGVGGSFDVYAGVVKRAPNWACRLHIEWLYRLLSQPRRILRQRNLVKYLLADMRGKL